MCLCVFAIYLSFFLTVSSHFLTTCSQRTYQDHYLLSARMVKRSQCLLTTLPPQFTLHSDTSESPYHLLYYGVSSLPYAQYRPGVYRFSSLACHPVYTQWSQMLIHTFSWDVCVGTVLVLVWGGCTQTPTWPWTGTRLRSRRRAGETEPDRPRPSPRWPAAGRTRVQRFSSLLRRREHHDLAHRWTQDRAHRWTQDRAHRWRARHGRQRPITV